MPLALQRVLGFGLVMGVAFAGGWWGGRASAPRGGDSTGTKIPQATPALASLEAEIARQREANDRLREQFARAEGSRPPPVPAAAAAPDRLRLLEDAMKRAGLQPRLKMIAPGGKLDRGFAELFDLGPADVARLEIALAQAKQSVERLIEANMTVTELSRLTNAFGVVVSTGGYQVTVRPFDGGKQVYVDLMQSFDTTLGSDRSAIFRALEDEQFTRYLSHYGTEERRLTVRHSPARGRFPDRYRVTEESRLDSDAPQEFVFHTHDLAALKAEYGVLLNYLPASFEPKR